MSTTARPPFRRMIIIDKEIRQNKYPNKRILAQILEVDQKTIQRDISFMREQLQAPLKYCAKNRGYCYKETNYFLPVNCYSDKEIFAFKIAQQVLSAYKGTPYFKELGKILDKVLQLLPEDVSVDVIEPSFSFDVGPISPISKNIFENIDQAIKNNFTVKVNYHSFSSNTVKERLLNPYHIFDRHSKWHIAAYCHENKQVRTFTLNRILSIDLTKEKFVKPNFSIEKYLAGSFALEKGGKTHHVKLHISEYQGKWIKERKWHRSQKIKKLEDGSMIFSMKVKGLNDVKRWILQYGAEIEVLEPEELRDMIKEEVQKMRKIYK